MRIETTSPSSDQKKKELPFRWVLAPFFGLAKMLHTIFLAPVLGCLFRLLIFIMVLFFLFSFLFIKSGLWHIPYISSWIYTPDPPHKYIIAIPPEKSLEYINQEIAQIIDQRKDALTISSEHATGLIQGVIRQNNTYELSSIQIAIMADGMQVYVQVKRPFDTIVTTTVHPYLKDGAVKYDISSTKLGDLPVPSFLVSSFIQGWLQSSLNPLLNEVRGGVRSIETRGGYLYIQFQ